MFQFEYLRLNSNGDTVIDPDEEYSLLEKRCIIAFVIYILLILPLCIINENFDEVMGWFWILAFAPATFSMIYGVLFINRIVRTLCSSHNKSLGTLCPPQLRPSLSRLCLPLGSALTLFLLYFKVSSNNLYDPFMIMSPFWVSFVISHGMLITNPPSKRWLETNTLRILGCATFCTSILVALNLVYVNRHELLMKWFISFSPLWATTFCLSLGYALVEVTSITLITLNRTCVAICVSYSVLILLSKHNTKHHQNMPLWDFHAMAHPISIRFKYYICRIFCFMFDCLF